MDNSRRRVVVTGMGIVSPVGNDLDTAWKSILEGRSGIGPITHYDAAAYSPRFAGLVKDFDASAWLGPKEVRKTDPFIHYGIAAAKQAMSDAGLEVTDANRDRIGVLRVVSIDKCVEALHQFFVADAFFGREKPGRGDDGVARSSRVRVHGRGGLASRRWRGKRASPNARIRDGRWRHQRMKDAPGGFARAGGVNRLEVIALSIAQNGQSVPCSRRMPPLRPGHAGNR